MSIKAQSAMAIPLNLIAFWLIGSTKQTQPALLNTDLVHVAGHLVSSWHSQMNIRTVSPFFGSSILPTRRGLRPHL
jgi:hypothetical protein